MSDTKMRAWVWLGIAWLSAVCGLWAGVTGGYPPAVFSMFACWVLAITWFVASAGSTR